MTNLVTSWQDIVKTLDWLRQQDDSQNRIWNYDVMLKIVHYLSMNVSVAPKRFGVANRGDDAVVLQLCPHATQDYMWIRVFKYGIISVHHAQWNEGAGVLDYSHREYPIDFDGTPKGMEFAFVLSRIETLYNILTA